MKKILGIILVLILSLITNLSFAGKTVEEGEGNGNKNIIDDIIYSENIPVGESWNISLENLENTLKEAYSSDIVFEWDTAGETTKTGTDYQISFDSFGNKKISLNIYKFQNQEKELIINKDINIFAYKASLAFVFEDKLEEELIDFKLKAKEEGILIYNIGTLNINEIEKYNFLEKINYYKNTYKNPSDYIVIWGSKDFIFDTISKINSKIENEKLNLVLISSFNINILKSYLENFVANKVWIEKMLLLDELSKFELLKKSNNINDLEEEIIKNQYKYINLSNTENIKPFLFISKFINNLSNKGFSTQNIYLILIIPFLLVGVSFFKQFLGLTPTGVLIPTVITLLLFKLGGIATLTILLTFLFINLALAKLIGKYKLHYTPKVTLLTTINIVIFIVVLDIMDVRGLINININDIMFIILFILISERLINIIVSKEFGEYKATLINTLIYSIIAYIFLSINLVETFILAYPEIILILIPISFLIGKFTGLRATEYFRFKEIIKGIEE